MAKNMQKPLVFVGQNKDACFYVMIALETDSGPILGQFWIPKSLQNRPKIGSERYPASCSFLNAIQDLQKSIFRPTWPQLGSKMAPKWAPKNYFFRGFWEPRRDLERPKAPTTASFQFWTDFGPILDGFRGRFWMVLGYIFEWFFKYLLFVICPLLFIAWDLLLVVCCLFGVLCCFAICCWLFFIVCCLPCVV